MSTYGKPHPPRSASTFPGISGKILGALAALSALAGALEAAPAFRRLPLAEYRDRMKGGWIGQMAGVAWGGPTEFRYQGRIIPERELPCWVPQMINDFPKLIDACEKVAREAVVKAGGHVEKDPQGGETLVIPIQKPKPEALEECWDPAPPSGSRFTDAEMARIRDPR